MKNEKAKNKQKVAADPCQRDSFDEWGLTFDAIPDQIALIDRDMRLTRVNKAFAQQFGKRPDDFIGEPCYKHICRSTEPKENCPHLRTVRDGMSYSVDLHLEHLGGDYLITTTPLCDRHCKICGSVHIARDITDSKKASDALRIVKEQQDGILLAILDVQLSGPRGSDLFGRLKTLMPGLRVLISSGYDESTALSEFREDRPDGFIQKPYWIDSLRDKMLEVLQGGNSGG